MSKKHRQRHYNNPSRPVQTPVEGAASEPVSPATVQGAEAEAALVPAVPARAPAAPLPESGDLFPTPVGMRLRAAREARGLTLDEVARAVHIPSAVLADIEADRLERLGAPIYVRGYLRTYARHVGLAEAAVAGATERLEQPQPTLVARPTRSRSRYLAARYANAVAYALLTLVVMVPLVMFVMSRQGARPQAAAPRLETIDAPLVALPPAMADGTASARDALASSADIAPTAPEVAAPSVVSSSVVEEISQPEPQQPVMASMAPLPEQIAGPEAEVPAAVSPDKGQKVVLRLAQPSWVELTGFQGQRIEYALLPAGTVREYQIAGRASLRIGNTRGATLQVDGRNVDLGAYSRSNVARVDLGSARRTP